MALPEAALGAECCDEETSPEANDHTEKFAVFGMTSFLILPLILVFLPSDQVAQASRHASAISRGELLWPFFAVWWTHGVINAIGVAKMRLRYRKALAARKTREDSIRARSGG